MAIERIDNGDGTTTFRGVDVTIPTSVADGHDVAEVRKAKDGEMIELCGRVDKSYGSAYCRVILTPRPAWKPPASLMPGEYEWTAMALHFCGGGYITDDWAKRVMRDWSRPSREGKWRVNEDGTATYLGDS